MEGNHTHADANLCVLCYSQVECAFEGFCQDCNTGSNAHGDANLSESCAQEISCASEELCEDSYSGSHVHSKAILMLSMLCPSQGDVCARVHCV